MWTFLWKVIYAAVCVVIFFWIVPLFLVVIGLNVVGPLWTLIKACVACLALLYVLFGPPPRTPF